MNHKEPMTLEDILDIIVLKESEPSHEALTRWCADYPEHRETLARFFTTWAVQKEMPKGTAIDEERVSDRMVSHALNVLYRQTAAQSAASQTEPAVRLCDAVTSAGISEEDFTEQCGLDETIVAKLDRRLIRFASIPRTCLERIASGLRLGLEAVRKILSGEPIPLRSHKARGQPAVKVEDFADAVRTSSLSEEQRAEWIRIVTSEKPD